MLACWQQGFVLGVSRGQRHVLRLVIWRRPRASAALNCTHRPYYWLPMGPSGPLPARHLRALEPTHLTKASIPCTHARTWLRYSTAAGPATASTRRMPLAMPLSDRICRARCGTGGKRFVRLRCWLSMCSTQAGSSCAVDSARHSLVPRTSQPQPPSRPITASPPSNPSLHSYRTPPTRAIHTPTPTHAHSLP